LLIWLRSWSVVIERAHAHLMTRPDLGDVGRLVRFFAAVVGYGVGSLVVLWATIALLAAVDG
jgi:hypothetical protein